MSETIATGARLRGKSIALTGGAGGLGSELAPLLAAEGALLTIGDINEVAAEQVAARCRADYGDCAIARGVDVTDESSVAQFMDAAYARFGALDAVICAVGIVDAGGLDDMTLRRFERVTRVNYTSLFLCAKYASGIMKRQRAARPDAMFDIIHINSKSGLEGSDKNFAYAGSKFGCIGLVQSFARELAPYGIKVNAICPGNLLDGPLWSDPQSGLFTQYLNAGKVPGAQNVADVRRYYESKVPLKRGCATQDVARAIMYCIEQRYETGQAIPVTGGQVMLN